MGHGPVHLPRIKAVLGPDLSQHLQFLIEMFLVRNIDSCIDQGGQDSTILSQVVMAQAQIVNLHIRIGGLSQDRSLSDGYTNEDTSYHLTVTKLALRVNISKTW